MFLTTRMTERGECTVIAVEGELDMSTAGEPREAIASGINGSELAIVLDLADLSFCDSAGLAVFVRAHNDLDERGRKLFVMRPTPAVSRILELSGLAKVIPTVADPDEARAKVANP